MASTAGHGIMDSEVAGSIPTFIPIERQKKKMEYISCSRTYKTHPTWKTPRRNDESNAIIAKSLQYREVEKSVKVDTGNLIGVPGIIWEICQV